MPNFAPALLISAPQHARSVASVPAIILLGMALLVSACTDGSNDTIRSEGTDRKSVV